MESEKFYIPQHLDAPPRFLLWTVDEAMSFIFPILLGVFLGSIWIGLCISYFSYRTWRRLKSSSVRGFSTRLIYWYYPSRLLDLKSTPDSAIRTFLG